MRTNERETTVTDRDPVCGMAVDPKSAAATVKRNGESFYFCSTHCRDKFVAGNEEPNETKNTASARRPAKKYFCPMCEGVESDAPGACPNCGMALERNPTFREPIIYTCPMHPRIEQDHPGNCPICGMALEPKNVVASGRRR